ncbi:tRNA adenosine deaminase-associated protein [Nocardioides solisilvae]|uniref:tRNA adenosine deaminase-associated protein n=1 Tax=Nocardioides solisilvae TaxID=1542435 RepID=UPI000D7456F8|nr:tRNA adenosine deaminase-associated protein [Nocardioides solisilvae]
MGLAPEQLEGIDFALAARREEGRWRLDELAESACGSVEEIAHALRRLPGEGGALGMVAVDEDFFVMVRVEGSTTRVLLSDVSAAGEWELARSVVEFLGVIPEDEDAREPAGDLGLVADLGMHAVDMAVLLDDVDLYPDEMLSDVARRLGFGPEFDDAVGLSAV